MTTETTTPETVEQDTLRSDEQLVQQPGSAVTFVSRRRELRLILEPRETVFNASMKPVSQTKGRRVEFRDAHFMLDREKDAALIEELEAHELCGNQFNGFWRAVEPAPEATPAEMDRLVQAAIALDVDTLREFVAQEEAGYAREDVLATARGALEKVEAVLARDGERVELAADPEAPEDPELPPAA